ncbi:glycoside hydrolase family 95 protein, partial [Xanthomonas euvesicatoria]|nr:glycoside hydrolase family 95 protein [Xanthomonas euvesicatoria]
MPARSRPRPRPASSTTASRSACCSARLRRAKRVVDDRRPSSVDEQPDAGTPQGRRARFRSVSTAVAVLTRRELCKATGGAIPGLGAVPGGSPGAPASETTAPAPGAAAQAPPLGYRRPGNEVVEALPVGNGALGA